MTKEKFQNTPNKFFDPEFIGKAEYRFPDLLSGRRQNVSPGQTDKRAERHITDSAELNQQKDDNLTQEIEIAASADSGQSGGGYRRSRGEKRGQGSHLSGLGVTDRKSKQNPAENHIGKVPHGHLSNRINAGKERCRDAKKSFHINRTLSRKRQFLAIAKPIILINYTQTAFFSNSDLSIKGKPRSRGRRGRGLLLTEVGAYASRKPSSSPSGSGAERSQVLSISTGRPVELDLSNEHMISSTW